MKLSDHIIDYSTSDSFRMVGAEEDCVESLNRLFDKYYEKLKKLGKISPGIDISEELIFPDGFTKQLADEIDTVYEGSPLLVRSHVLQTVVERLSYSHKLTL